MKVTTLAFAAILRLSAAAAMNVAYERSSGEHAFDSSASPLRLRTQPKHVSKQQPNRRIKSDEVVKQEVVVAEASSSMSSSLSTSLSMSMSISMSPSISMSMSTSMSTSTSTSISMSVPDVAMCSFCAAGLVDPELVLPTDDGATCGQAQAYASSFEETDPNCAMVKMAESLCCPATIYDIGMANPDFSTLVSLIDAAGLAEALQGTDPLTVAAPTNDAFAALPEGTLEYLLLPENVEQLKAILLYHVVAGAIPSSDIVPGDVETLNGGTVAVAVSETGITLNDANVIVADIPASNGIIYVIDKVLIPPAQETGSTAAPGAEMCSFCPDGLTNPDLVLPTPDQDTCTDALNYALTLAADNSECDYVLSGEFLCCPDAATTAATSATTPTTPTDVCSCSPVQYNFVLSLDQNCTVDTINDNVGVGSTYCFLGVSPSPVGRRRLASVSFVADMGGRELTEDELQSMRQLASTSEIISVQFIEFDTSGELIVINQDDTYSNVSLANGAVVTFTSISSELDPTLPISDQLELVPGGIQLMVKAKVTDDVTGVTTIVDNRVAWTYTNECGVDPIEVGEGISWVTLGEHTDAAEAFCSAAVATTTTEAPPTTTEAPPATTEAPPTTTEAPPVTTEAPPTTTEAPPVTTEAPIEIDMSMSLSTPSLFGAKSGKAKALKSKAHAKTEKNTMAKVYKAKESDAKSGKSKALKDAKAEKELPSSKSGKRAKTAYHMFSKGNKMSMPAQSSMSL